MLQARFLDSVLDTRQKETYTYSLTRVAATITMNLWFPFVVSQMGEKHFPRRENNPGCPLQKTVAQYWAHMLATGDEGQDMWAGPGRSELRDTRTPAHTSFSCKKDRKLNLY